MCVFCNRLCLAMCLSDILIKPLHLLAGEWQESGWLGCGYIHIPDEARFSEGLLHSIQKLHQIADLQQNNYHSLLAVLETAWSFEWANTWWMIDTNNSEMSWFSVPAKSIMLLDFHFFKLNINMNKLNILFIFFNTLPCKFWVSKMVSLLLEEHYFGQLLLTRIQNLSVLFL